jgi:hypothetical protein
MKLKKRESIQKTHEKKLDKLISNNEKYPHNHKRNKNEKEEQQRTSETNVMNTSNIKVSGKQLRILEKGLNYVPTPKTLDLIEYINNTEKSLFTTPALINPETPTYINA